MSKPSGLHPQDNISSAVNLLSRFRGQRSEKRPEYSELRLRFYRLQVKGHTTPPLSRNKMAAELKSPLDRRDKRVDTGHGWTDTRDKTSGDLDVPQVHESLWCTTHILSLQVQRTPQRQVNSPCGGGELRVGSRCRPGPGYRTNSACRTLGGDSEESWKGFLGDLETRKGMQRCGLRSAARFCSSSLYPGPTFDKSLTTDLYQSALF